MKARTGLPHAWKTRAVPCLVIGTVLWAAEPLDAQTTRRGDERNRPSVEAEVVEGSLARSPEALSFRIAVTVPAGHHGYLDEGDDGFFIPFAFSFPALEDTDVAVEVTSAPRGVRSEKARAQVLRGRGRFAFRMVPAPRTMAELTARLRYQICNDTTNLCYPPRILRIPVALDGGDHRPPSGCVLPPRR